MSLQQPFVAGRVRRRGWVRVARGLHVPPAMSASDAPLHALASRLHEDGGFTHLTAAHVLGWWLPPLPPGLPEFAAQSDTRNRARREELRIIRTTPEPTVRMINGLPAAPPADVLLALGRHLSVLDVVVGLDSALRAGHVTPQELAAALRSRRWGVRTLRAAASLADRRSESPFESLLRVLHLVCEVPVVPQHEVRVGGVLVARGDLRIVGHAVLHEYDGEGHRDRDQHRADLRRDRDLQGAGWLRRGYTDLEVLRRPVTILRDADRTLGRAHDPTRLDAWYDLLRESCFTASGRRRLLRRLGLADAG